MVRRVLGWAAVSIVACACHKGQDATARQDTPSAAPTDSSLVAAAAPSDQVANASASGGAGAGAEPSASVEQRGMIGLLNSGADPNAPTAPWGRDDSGDASARGNMWGDAIGDSFGAGGLGLRGVGAGDAGGGRGEGIGLGNIGTSGGSGRLGSGRRVNPPKLRQGVTTVTGRLPPEVVQRIVRQNFGRFRLCYENGLRSNPTLAGTVTTKFVIDTQGSVKSSTREASTTMTDATVVSCINRAFTNLSFPQPESGIVTVIYPLILSPPDP